MGHDLVPPRPPREGTGGGEPVAAPRRPDPATPGRWPL